MTKISRRSFLKLASTLGLTAVIPTALTGCIDEFLEEDSAYSESDSSVLIIGAGAAGMSAAYLLKQQGINVQILEAASTYGGRIKRTTTFTDFPIPLGGEWLHVRESELTKIVNDSSVNITTEMKAYDPQDTGGHFEGGELRLGELEGWSDLKFVGSSWLDFYDQYIVPSIRTDMQFNTQIVDIDYGGSGVVATDQNGNDYSADMIIVAVPLKILQDGDIGFTPDLPEDKVEAGLSANIWGGIKVFLEFSEKFYPTVLTFPDSETNDGQRLYYDAAYGQDSDSNILGLFAVGRQAEQYQALDPETAVRDYILAELDEAFDGQASATYVKHIVQDWNKEPFIRAAYFADVGDWRIPPVISEPVNGKLFFAGTAFTDGEDWGSVHTAAQSARNASSFKIMVTSLAPWSGGKEKFWRFRCERLP